jgi:very-short-patch-repair endonuclease
MRQQSANRGPDRQVSALAATQFGVVTSAQLRECGLTTSGIARRERAGRLHRVHRGVYAVGHPRLGNEGEWLAAVLACGEGAVLSHRSAAELWGFLALRRARPDVTVQGSGGRGRAGIRVHRSVLAESERARRLGIPVTSPQRTLADLRRTCSSTEVMRATRQAEYLGLVEEVAGEERIRSHLEQRFLRLCRDAGLPMPLANQRVGPYEVDFVWAGSTLIVETDGYGAHRGRVAFERDRIRDVWLRLQGYEVVRVTHRQVTEEPLALVRLLRSRLT